MIPENIFRSKTLKTSYVRKLINKIEIPGFMNPFQMTNFKLKRKLKHCWQHLTRGWTDEDTWSLDYVLAKFVYPRLVRFKELNNGFPGGLGFTEESWNEALDNMIYAMRVIAKDEINDYDDELHCSVNWAKMQLGLEQFGKYFRDLWW
jgi:hypothetical protein